METKLGTDPETGRCLDCAAGNHGIVKDGWCVCCSAKVTSESGTFSVRDEYTPTFGRQNLTLWSGPFASNYEGSARELPNHDGFMVSLFRGQVRVTCPSPRDDDNWMQVDEAINAALAAAGKEVSR